LRGAISVSVVAGFNVAGVDSDDFNTTSRSAVVVLAVSELVTIVVEIIGIEDAVAVESSGAISAHDDSMAKLMS
jgi:hypothetical protein